MADAGAVHAAAANAANDVGDDERLNGWREAGADPADADENAADHDDGALAELVDERALKGHEPGLGQDKAAEGGRDLGEGDELGGRSCGVGEKLSHQRIGE